MVYRREGDDIEVLLASRRTRRGDLAWGLAKGGIEADETIEDAAVREVREETGIDAEIEASLGDTRYFYVWDDVRDPQDRALLPDAMHSAATRTTTTTRWRTCAGSRWTAR